MSVRTCLRAVGPLVVLAVLACETKDSPTSGFPLPVPGVEDTIEITLPPVVDTTTGTNPVQGEVLSFTISQLTLDVGQVAQLGVSLTNALGQPLPTDSLTWESTNPAVVTVTAAGEASGVGPGLAAIRVYTQAQTAASLPVEVLDTTTVVTNPPGGGVVGFPNRPAGLTTLVDEGWNTAWSGTDGNYPGWDCGIWRPNTVSTVDDPTAPDGPRVLKTVIPDGSNGGGALTCHQGLPGSYDEFYVAFWLKYETGFYHNGTSEKQLYFNFGDSDYFMFQYLWFSEVMYNIDDAGGVEFLEANQMPRRPLDNVPDASPVQGVWMFYEFHFDRSTGSVRWWRDGQLRAVHTGRSFPALHTITVDDTWGGGGTKQGSEARLVDRIVVAGR